MKKLDPPWEDYLAAQTKLRDRSTVDDTSWSLEARLDRMLAGAANTDEVERAGRTAARRERSRAAQRRRHAATNSIDGVRIAVAGVALGQVRSAVEDDWPLLDDLGQGATFDELGEKRGKSAGAMRQRVFRLRNLLLKHVA